MSSQSPTFGGVMVRVCGKGTPPGTSGVGFSNSTLYDFAPETFGTPQVIVAGHAVVPPRDYAKGVKIPDPSQYDTIESGTIYDIAYMGIEKGELAFEQRGYSIDDLVHASSAQTMRFPLSQKSIRILDIEIAVLDVTPQRLRFRASLTPREADDTPFVCNDPACTAR